MEKDYIFSGYSRGLKEEKSQDILHKVLEHKKRFVKLFTNRYFEMLPSLITYQMKPTDKEKVSINFLRLEHALRRGRNVIIGENINGKLVILGYVNQSENYNPTFLNEPLINTNDIEFTIDKRFIKPLSTYKEITELDNFKTGNFVVIRNKFINTVSDLEIVEHYVDELAEIITSRYSVIMQSKIMTFFTSTEQGSQTVNQILNDLYNGNPFVKVGHGFDPDENMREWAGSQAPALLTELKREYQNKISELNNMLGINSLAVEKTSGVSDTEAKSNRAYTTSNSNIYLEPRNEALSKLNKRYNLSLCAVYNDRVISELEEQTETEKEKGEGESEEHSNNL